MSRAPKPGPADATGDGDASQPEQDGAADTSENTLEFAIGRQVREFRTLMEMTVVDLAKHADLSAGMLSKIENGQTSPSLNTLHRLSVALNVPVTAFFRKFEEQRDATHVRAGEGLTIERRGTRAGHQYQLLGHTVGKPIIMEPYFVTMTEESEVFPVFQHTGLEFIYMIEGEAGYRHGSKLYDLKPGDSLFFDAESPHGPEELRVLPIRMLSVIVYPRDDS
ncbi:helix-turn-helix domain-containing protein [Roseospira navarrensis]|uniref:Helix-turn-helix domain-containing protein n=1 Tax=Roseospira navarrensis TaxID=140058 RepID=A0A7X1ZDJ2_9PROT|nr:XRE family transcriptional regulator [Roseospira navarrensis]MQX36064.1 helix-turn-helix domain-containing protein [Roseospira navarrensis]